MHFSFNIEVSLIGQKVKKIQTAEKRKEIKRIIKTSSQIDLQVKSQYLFCLIEPFLPSLFGIIEILKAQYFMAKCIRVDILRQFVAFSQQNLLALSDFLLSHFLSFCWEYFKQLLPCNVWWSISLDSP